MLFSLSYRNPATVPLCVPWESDRVKAYSVAPVSKPALPNRLLNLAKRAFSKLDPCILAGSGCFETGAAERAHIIPLDLDRPSIGKACNQITHY